MRKRIYIDHRAEKELRVFNKDIQNEFNGYFEVLRKKGKLEFPDGRKIGRNLFEIRVRREGSYRGFMHILRGQILLC